MKIPSIRLLALSAAVLLAASSPVFADDVVKETRVTTSAGTISDLTPDTIVIHSETAPAPVRYHYSKTTTYVDEAGNPVSIETVKSGLPVTVYYSKVGDDMVVSKVIVKKVVEPAAVEKKTTTTTTTIQK